ncbi:MAG: ECF transporter S component [Clostridia bacterium]|nr:ECF transporter S component [Clostridia bacterium]
MAMNIILSMSVFSIPVPGGHLYFCDTVICMSAMLLDPVGAFVVGGIGSFLGDFLFYPAPMFVSLVTHGLQAMVIAGMTHGKAYRHPVRMAIAAVSVGAAIMVAGYTLGRAYVYATPEIALIKLPFEVLQAALGAVLSVILCYPLGLKKRFDSFFRS